MTEQRVTVAALDVLEGVIEKARVKRRGRRPKWAELLDDTWLANREIALAIMKPVLAPWRDAKPPTAMGVAKTIARLLSLQIRWGALRDDATQCGAALLKLAEDAGVIEIKEVE